LNLRQEKPSLQSFGEETKATNHDLLLFNHQGNVVERPWAKVEKRAWSERRRAALSPRLGEAFFDDFRQNHAWTNQTFFILRFSPLHFLFFYHQKIISDTDTFLQHTHGNLVIILYFSVFL
jgi:hypothetical protein